MTPSCHNHPDQKGERKCDCGGEHDNECCKCHSLGPPLQIKSKEAWKAGFYTTLGLMGLNPDQIDVILKQVSRLIAEAEEKGYERGYADGQIAAKGLYWSDISSAREDAYQKGLAFARAKHEKEIRELRKVMEDSKAFEKTHTSEYYGFCHQLDRALAAFDAKRQEQKEGK